MPNLSSPLAFGLALILAGASARAEVVPAAPANAQPAPTVETAVVPAVAPAAAPKPAPPKPAPLRLAPVSKDPRPSLGPETFVATGRAAEFYLRIAENGGWPTLPAGAALKAGDKGPLVARLRQRLAISGDLAPDAAPSDAYDAVLVAAVTAFQARHGLPETGILGPRTLAALNVPADRRYRQLAASTQRLLGSSFPFGPRYVVVNIPAATVEAVEQGKVVRRYVAVVGKKDRPSPPVEAKLVSVNLNPTWTLPVSIIKRDIIPQMRKDPTYLAKHRIRIFGASGQEIDPMKIDWATERAADFTLRQDPGVANSLGQVRIDMPNRHAVYLHDTPTKRLFAAQDRFHSSGCVRVAHVRDLAAWLLEGTPNGAPGAIEAGIASGERRDLKLPAPVPVAFVYLTGYATTDGTVHFRDDVYGLDERRETAPPADEFHTSAIPRPPRRL
jgi:L,D-transpeptidase YcbB